MEFDSRARKVRRKLALLSVLAISVFFLAPIGSLPLADNITAAFAAEPTAKTVELVVDYGDGVQKRFAALAFTDGMNVLDALQAAKRHAHGIDFEFAGKGEMAFLLSIDGQKNQGGGETGKNWVFRLNQKLGHKSFAVQTLAAGDVVLWRFEVYDH